MLNLLKKLLSILPVADKQRLIILFFLMGIAAAFEVVGISIILTFISALSNPEQIIEVVSRLPLLSNLSITSVFDILLFGSIALILVFLVKTAYLLFFYYIQSRFVNNKFKNIATSLFSHYMKAPYEFHLGNNTATLIRNITIETNIILSQILIPLISIFMEGILILAIVVFLFLMEPVITSLALLILGGTGGLLILSLKNLERNFGKDAQLARREMIQKTNEGLGGVKEILVLGREDWFVRKFKAATISLARAATFSQVSKQAFKPVIETVAVIGMLSIALIYLWQGREVDSIIPTLVLFGVATFQLMPSLVKLTSQYNKLRYYGHALTPIHNDLMSLSSQGSISDSKSTSPVTFEKNIELKKVSFTYPGNQKPILNGVNLKIEKGSIVGFVGGSGEGKTTIVDIILGLFVPDSGSVLIDGKDIQDNLASWQKHLGYIPQFIFLADDTIKNNIAFGIDEADINEDQINVAIALAQLESFITELPQGLDTVVGERGVRLSGGQRQRIGIARALYHDPQVLIMDEATSSLDTHTERGVIKSIEKLKGDRTILVIAHRLSTVKNCDNLYYVKNGKIADQGTYADLLENNKTFQSMVQEPE